MFKIPNKDKQIFSFQDLRFRISNLFRISDFGFRISRFAGGFTIIEPLVAIAILLLAITTPLTIAEKGLASAEVARQEITAFYLAQEAAEHIRNVRDENTLGGQGGKSGWLQGLNQCVSGGGCGIDPTSDNGQPLIACTISNDDCTLWQNDSTLIFGYPPGHGSGNSFGWTETGFKRKVYLEEIKNGVEASTTARVEWSSGPFGSRTIIVSENLFNWYVSP